MIFFSFRPNSVSNYPEQIKGACSIRYSIQTSFQLFETYLKECCKLKLLVINNQTKEIVGHVNIKHLYDLVTGVQYQKYFPIVTSSGRIIGDLKVDFKLTMNSFPEEMTLLKTKRRSRKKTKTIQSSFRKPCVEKTKNIKRDYKTCLENIKTTSSENKLNQESLVPQNTQRSETSECALWNVLDKSKQLRDAMVLSVLEEDYPDNEKLLLDPECDIKKTVYEPLKIKENGEVVSFHEEKLIKRYLEGWN